MFVLSSCIICPWTVHVIPFIVLLAHHVPHHIGLYFPSHFMSLSHVGIHSYVLICTFTIIKIAEVGKEKKEEKSGHPPPPYMVPPVAMYGVYGCVLYTCLHHVPVTRVTHTHTVVVSVVAIVIL